MCDRLWVILAAWVCCAALPLRAQEAENPPAYVPPPVVESASSGWSCGEFPCEDDREAFWERIRVPEGFALEHVGRFPGLVQQIAYGLDGRLHATVLEGGSAYGAVYTLREDGSTARYPALFHSPIGLAAQPETGELFVSARVNEGAGGIWRLREALPPQVIRADLPCCTEFPGNQPNGMVFAAAGVLYIGIGARSDHGETGEERLPEEAALLRLDVATGESEVIARGLRNPFDVALSAAGELYVTDQGTLRGPGDRVLAIKAGAHYGWPYWRWRDCVLCPPRPPEMTIAEDWLTLPEHSNPRGIVAYEGVQFPRNFLGNVFVTLWLNAAEGQRILRLDPASQTYETFVSGLMRPTDVVIAPDGTLVFADSVYGDIWRVRYVGVE
ncbi:MAG: PQQ-dependent sugar dehydrogenase [Anaerolineaceae bacterium]|nr:PQQ-dependent sugar dehydrogenase [Anaerolineaceae bacterium]